MERIAVTGASGNGKSTLAHELAVRLGLRFVDVEALDYGSNGTEASPEELRARVEDAIRDGRWVVDATYRAKLGDFLPEQADTVIWLDLPLRVILLRLLRRTLRRIRDRVDLSNGNVEPGWRDALRFLIWPAVLMHFANRRDVPRLFLQPPLRHLRLVRPRNAGEVGSFLERLYARNATASITGSSGASARQKRPPSSET